MTIVGFGEHILTTPKPKPKPKPKPSPNPISTPNPNTGEHIFTQSSGFVTAIYMALQEKYFCSFVQVTLSLLLTLTPTLTLLLLRAGYPSP